MIYGYVRISRKVQNIERQIRNILAQYPQALIVQEAYTGTTLQRPEWTKLYNKLSDGDTVIFDSISRMSRNAADGIRVYEDLFHRGVEIIFLKEPHINTSVYKRAAEQSIPMTGTTVDIILEAVNRYLLALAREQIEIAFQQAQKEVDDLHQRTREGMMTAKLNGKQIGRKQGATIETKKSKAAKEIIRKHSKSFGGTLNDSECQQLAGVSRNSYYKYKREISMQ
jgi:DNA invertase Pin-like site-specific DNA recombinase